MVCLRCTAFVCLFCAVLYKLRYYTSRWTPLVKDFMVGAVTGELDTRTYVVMLCGDLLCSTRGLPHAHDFFACECARRQAPAATPRTSDPFLSFHSLARYVSLYSTRFTHSPTVFYSFHSLAHSLPLCFDPLLLVSLTRPL